MGDIQIVLAEDQPLTLIGLRSAVAADSGIQVLAECQDRGRLVEAVKRHSPHVLFVSTDMLQEKLDALQHLVSVINETRVIVLTSQKDPGFLEGALRCGVKGVFQRDWPSHQIPVAIRKVTSGGVWVEHAVAERVLENLHNSREGHNPEARKIASLTPREREIIEWICKGAKSKMMAEQLRISEVTVSHHLTSIYRKLEVEDKTALVIYSVKQNLVTF